MVFTVRIEASDTAGHIWQALHPAENVEALPGETPNNVAMWVASHQQVAEGDGWRVRVWPGADADTGRPEIASFVANEAG